MAPSDSSRYRQQGFFSASGASGASWLLRKRGEQSLNATPRSLNSTPRRPLSQSGRPATSGSQSSGAQALGQKAQLPPSILKRTTPGNPKQASISAPYLWSPVQVCQHEQKTEMSYCVGTYVNTLSMDVANKTFEGASCHLMRLEPSFSTARESLWCYLVGGNFVICKGVVVGICPRDHDPANGRNMRIARLPVELRPNEPLQFAALSREAYDVGGHVAYSSQLVTLVVTPDGWIMGVASKEVEGAIDLSAIRFCIGKGISLIDGVSLHTCDIAGTRMVTLQGSLTERFFAMHRHKPLALLPESCRPPCELPFIVAGSSPGGFHLLIAYPSHGFGCGGDLLWRDSIWNHDKVSLTGIMYEVSHDAVQHSTLDTKWAGESQKIFVEDFQKFLIRRFGDIESAWEQAFDTDGSGAINFTEFGLGCKMAGFVGNATRLWAALDEDRSGEISMDELSVGVDQFNSNAGNTLSPRGTITGAFTDDPGRGAKRLSLNDFRRNTKESSEYRQDSSVMLPGMMHS